ncbi:MAG: ribonuclease P protein component [Azospirillaceae bacterium]|nr:ribonuclease P protein component [Azospirillaceae bacterium]
MAPRRAAVVGRLLKRSEFLAVAGARRKWATPGLILQARAHDDRQRPPAGDVLVRVGFTASKKVGNAVARNRARRRLRAAVAAVLAPHAKPAHDFVVIARSETVTRPYADLVRDLAHALKKLGAWVDGAPAPAADDGGTVPGGDPPAP